MQTTNLATALYQSSRLTGGSSSQTVNRQCDMQPLTRLYTHFVRRFVNRAHLRVNRLALMLKRALATKCGINRVNVQKQIKMQNVKRANAIEAKANAK